MGFLDGLFALGNQGPKNPIRNATILPQPSQPELRTQYPYAYGLLGGLAGTAPDEMGGSVLDPQTARVQEGAKAGYPASFLSIIGAPEIAASKIGLLGMAIDPKSQKLLAKNLAGKVTQEPYRLGDIKPEQAKGILSYVGSQSPTSLDVRMPIWGESHIKDSRIVDDGFSPDFTASVAAQAMRADSKVMPPKSASDYPTLLSARMIDPASGQPYRAMMPLKPTENGFDVVSVIPKGLPAPNKKAP